MKNATSSYFFIRATALLIGGIILVALLLDLLLLSLPDDSAAPSDALRAEFALIETLVLDDATARNNFSTVQEQIAAAVGMPVALYNRNEFAGLETELTGLNDGSIVTLFDDKNQAIHYKLLPQSELVLALGPLPGQATEGLNARLVSWSYYLLIGLLILLWIRPFYRDLDRLRSAALRFGDNDFSARVDVPPDSRILPVARSFNAMAERIEYLVSSHRELTNAVSHELRTPLARFKFSMEILARTEDAAKKEEYLLNMKQDVEELEQLIDEMLSYAKLNEQNLLLQLEEVALASWLESLASEYDREAIRLKLCIGKENGTALRTTMNPPLMARAINNILRNCLRYADSRITLTARQADGLTEISIQDDGKGIAEDKIASIFEPFSRGDTSRDRQSGGYGLGLAIAARIVQRHHGTIEAGNASPQGARFVLRWPISHQL